MAGWKPRRLSKKERDAVFEKMESPAVQAKIKEGFDQIERGECVRIPIDEIKRRLRKLKFD